MAVERPGDETRGSTAGDEMDAAREEEVPELRQVSDAQTMRALAHPVRIALMEVLGLQGPMTATEAGERIGESPTTCSFHLRQLAKYGFVEEAGGGKGRARPWRLSTFGMRFSAGEDSESELALLAVTQLFRERALGRYRSWLEGRSAYPRRWRQAADESEYIFYLTAEELEALSEDLFRLLAPRFRERLTDPSTRPPGAVAVEMLVLSYPVEPVPAAPVPAEPVPVDPAPPEPPR
jgi:DNA-binding transcriptional ArsR family regulator